VSEGFPAAAREALGNEQLRRNLRVATHTIRAKRAAVVAERPDWEELREAGRAIKERVLRHLDGYLVEFEQAVERAGGSVHWARDAEEACRVVAALVHATGEREVVKVKSLTTDEIRLNESLAAVGIDVVETDLAELICQLAGEESSHILVPAIHKNRVEIRDLFRRELGLPNVSEEPSELAEAARLHLRERFLRARVAVSGANFAVAETGTVCVVESEGNGRFCTTLPETLITVLGIEKLVPAPEDLEVFLQLLPRSSTGERMNPYTSLWTGVTPGDGPQEFHVVLLDAGRTDVLADEVGRQTLACIRCSACLNVCPVYERTGGHAYESVYPGPIGAILTPQLRGIASAASLPYASSLCGACYEVCPVKIDIPEVLIHLRGRVVAESLPSRGERAAMRELARIFASERRYKVAQRVARIAGRPFARGGRIRRLPGLGAWTETRDLRPVARQTFREWWDSR
jgi:L-lactate dehydrogenase complex protein LldF